MSWFPETKLSRLERFCLNVLKMGPVPYHVAIIMDGNRRFANKNCMEKIEGHSLGFEKLTQVLNWSRELEVKEVTVYAFSIENFNRPKEEVDALMNLAIEKFKKLLEEKKYLHENEVNVRVHGQLSLLPPQLQKLVAEIMIETKDNKKSVLNVCMAYTSRQEMAHAIKELAEGVQQGSLNPNNINEALLSQCLYSYASPPIDLMIRTSGEVRLSDFQLWQCNYSVLAFMDVLWPEFKFRHFVMAILYYQRNKPSEEDLLLVKNKEKLTGECADFLKRLHLNREQYFLSLRNGVC